MKKKEEDQQQGNMAMERQDRCVLTRYDVQSIKDLVFIVGGNSESSAQKAIFEILANNMRRSHPQSEFAAIRAAAKAEGAKEERERLLQQFIYNIDCSAESPEEANEDQCMECVLAMTHIGCYHGNVLDTRVVFDGCLIEFLQQQQEREQR